MRFLYLSVFLLGLVACGGSDDGDSSTNESITISDSTIARDIEGTNPIDLTISGSANAITIKSGTTLASFFVSGSNNLLTIEPDVVISNNCAITGNDNTFTSPDNVQYSCGNSGIGNLDIEYTPISGSAYPLIEMNGYKTTTSINTTTKSDIDIKGYKDIITISSTSEVAFLSLGGYENTVTIESNVTVDTCAFIGNNTTLMVPALMTISCESGGFGNSLITY